MSVTAGYMVLLAILPLMLRMMTAPVPARSGMMPAAGGYLNLIHTSSGLWADIVAREPATA